MLLFPPVMHVSVFRYLLLVLLCCVHVHHFLIKSSHPSQHHPEKNSTFEASTRKKLVDPAVYDKIKLFDSPAGQSRRSEDSTEGYVNWLT
jgi:hypothetical protein